MVVALWLLGGCGSGGGERADEPATDAPATITVSSPAFDDGGTVPHRFTCHADDVSPPLRWSGVPADARSLALVVTDPDAPGGTYVHWVVLDIDPTTTHVAADAVPAGGTQAANSAGNASYDGPCPPSGTHHYRFTVVALSAPTGLGADAGPADALAAVDEKAVARGTLVGLVGD